MSPLRRRLEEYLSVRRALGFKLEREGRVLPDFLTYLEERGTDVITTTMAMDWAMERSGASRDRASRRLSPVRIFARHIKAIDPRTEVPPSSLWPCRVHRGTPFLYSEEDIVRLVEAAGTLRPPLRAATYTTLLGLLAITGMRVGEALRLDRQDVDDHQGLLVIRHSKFDKSREVPVHVTTARKLRAYACVRDKLCPQRKAPAFFLSTVGTRPIYNNILRTFHLLLRNTGQPHLSGTCRPRIHDLRHTFAVRTLLHWYRAGLDVEALLPRLSTYLGHVCPASTYWYLSAAPELLALAAERLPPAQRERP
jgi:integrase